MRLIIKINKLQVWEFEVGPTDEFSVEFSQSDSAKARKAFEKEIAYFETFRQEYKKAGGVVRGLETEFTNFCKKTKNWKEELPKLYSAVLLEKEFKTKQKFRGEFVPSWKNMQTWINNRCWEMEFDTKPTPKLDRIVTFPTE